MRRPTAPPYSGSGPRIGVYSTVPRHRYAIFSPLKTIDTSTQGTTVKPVVQRENSSYIAPTNAESSVSSLSEHTVSSKIQLELSDQILSPLPTLLSVNINLSLP